MAKGNLRAELLLAGEDSGARMTRLGASLLLHGEVLTVDELLARIDAVERAHVLEVAAELAQAPRTLSAVGPFDEADLGVPRCPPGPAGSLLAMVSGGARRSC